MQRQEQERVDREHATKKAHRKRVVMIFAHQRGWKRNEGLAHQKNRFQPQEGVIGVARQPEQVMVIEPELADNDEA